MTAEDGRRTTSRTSPPGRTAPLRAGGASLVADLGGTRARFATLDPAGEPSGVEVMRCADHPTLEDAVSAYRSARGVDRVAEACFAVAGPVEGDVVDLLNNPWIVSRPALERALDGASVRIVNDFTAQALAIDLLRPDQLAWLGEPRPRNGGGRVVLGPGTGLGVAIRTPAGEVLQSEGGHVGFAPANEREAELLYLLGSRFRRLSVERVLSGPGLENLHWASGRLEGGATATEVAAVDAPEIVRRAERGDDLALRCVGDFLGILASFAGDLALVAWARGGVYLSGGVLGNLVPFLDEERFRARFEDKGRFARFCASVPVARVACEHPGLVGCAAVLAGARAGGCEARAARPAGARRNDDPSDPEPAHPHPPGGDRP